MANQEFKIIKKSGEINTYDEYDLLESPAIVSLKNIEHKSIICVGLWVDYITKDKNGDEIECISIQDANTGESYSGQSKTFRDSFSGIVDRVKSMDPVPENFFIEVLHNTSKSGREFINCALVSPDRALKRLGIGFDEPTL
jgi:hypothetical protein|nr:MAG TPA: ssDNA binding protein [Caudoviricetes sp.]